MIKGLNDIPIPSALVQRMIQNAESKPIRHDSVLKENALVGLPLDNGKILPKKGEKAGSNRIIVFLYPAETGAESTFLLCDDNGKPLFLHKNLDLCRLMAQSNITTANKIKV